MMAPVANKTAEASVMLRMEKMVTKRPARGDADAMAIRYAEVNHMASS